MTVACIQTGIRLWMLKMKDTKGELYFHMESKLDLAKYEVSLAELGGEAVKLTNLLERAVIKSLILYCNIDFHPYLPNVSLF